MATPAQKTAEVTTATRKVEATSKKLDQLTAEVAALTKLLASQKAHLEWVKAMPVDDEPETTAVEADPFAEADEGTKSK